MDGYASRRCARGRVEVSERLVMPNKIYSCLSLLPLSHSAARVGLRSHNLRSLCPNIWGAQLVRGLPVYHKKLYLLPLQDAAGD